MKYFKNNQNQILSTESTDERYLRFLAKGGYVEIGESEYNELANPKPSLDELKAEKIKELELKSNRFDNELKNKDMIIVSSLGYPIDADLRSQNNIRGLLAVISTKEKFAFMDANNNQQVVTKANLNTMLDECAKNGQNLYAQKWAYKQSIANAKDESELNEIEINFKMMDFSK